MQTDYEKELANDLLRDFYDHFVCLKRSDRRDAIMYNHILEVFEKVATSKFSAENQEKKSLDNRRIRSIIIA